MGDIEIIKRALEICTLEPDAMFAKHHKEIRNGALALNKIKTRIALLEVLLENIVIASKIENGNEELDRAIDGANYYLLTGKESKKGSHDVITKG